LLKTESCGIGQVYIAAVLSLPLLQAMNKTVIATAASHFIL
jgi:hypothetical protein